MGLTSLILGQVNDRFSHQHSPLKDVKAQLSSGELDIFIFQATLILSLVGHLPSSPLCLLWFPVLCSSPEAQRHPAGWISDWLLTFPESWQKASQSAGPSRPFMQSCGPGALWVMQLSPPPKRGKWFQDRSRASLRDLVSLGWMWNIVKAKCLTTCILTLFYACKLVIFDLVQDFRFCFLGSE